MRVELINAIAIDGLNFHEILIVIMVLHHPHNFPITSLLHPKAQTF